MTNSTTPPPSLKEVPKQASKSDIYQMYNAQSSKTVRRTIQLAIDDVNGNSRIRYSKNVSKLNGKHIQIIWEELGAPPGYKDLE